jgi:type I restriction enzyme S subunit
VSAGRTVRLDDACNVEYGTRVVQKRDGGSIYPVYGGGGATFCMDRFNREDRLVVARFGMSEDCTRFVSGKFFLNDSGLTVSPKDHCLVPRFLDYQMISLNDAIYALGSGTAQKNLNVPAFRTLPLVVPPASEQRRIVAILDEAFEGIAFAKANAESNLRNARALFTSQLRALLGQSGQDWKRMTLQEVALDFGRGRSKYRPRNAPHLYGGKYPFVQTGDVRNADHIVTEYTQTYNEAGLAQSKLWPKGTVCITIAANIAETAVLGFDACFPDSVIGLAVNPGKADQGFVEYLLQSYRERLQAMGKGSAQDNINMGTFENERFPFPPVAQQKEIATRLDRTRAEAGALVSLYQQKVTALEALKKSLLHQAFTGQLTSRAA